MTETHAAAPLYLQRIDPERNMRRFYFLALQPTLFGGASLMRGWGRIGRSGREMAETFDTAEDARRAFHRQAQRKRHRGYQEP